MAYRNYSPAVGLIVDKNGHGDFKTVQAAVTAAVAGQTVYINDGVYTENVTMKPSVALVGFPGVGYLPNVTILGELTFTSVGNYLVSSIQIQTNSSYALSITGSSAISIQCDNCYINCSNNTGINFTNSNSGSSIAFFNCSGNVGTTGIAFYSMSCPGDILFFRSDVQNSGGTSVASNNSAGSVSFFNCTLSTPHSTSGTGLLTISSTNIDTSKENATSLTSSGTGIITAISSTFISGTASCVSVGTGTTLYTSHVTASSSNTDVFTGGGTWNYAYTVFLGSSHGHNVSTETALSTF